jgi:hypothetical protein
MLTLLLILLLSSLLAFSKDKDREAKTEKKKNETVETVVVSKTNVDSEKFKEDLQKSVLEFIGDMKANPDTCYIPFKK